MSQSQIKAIKNNVLELPISARWVYSLLGGIRIGQIRVLTDEGQEHTFAGQTHPELKAEWRLHHPARLLSRLARLGDIGIAEAYIHGDFSTDNLTRLLEIGARNMDVMRDDLRAGFWARLIHRLQHALRSNHKRGSRRNISAHYDLGNEFYRLWLDPSMTYSSALFSRPDEPMAEAQARKYQRLIDALEAKPGDHILEIGCGWGGFAEQATGQGIHVSGITLSTEQQAFAIERMACVKHPAQAEFFLRDYRDQTGTFDHIVSVEMFEAVGEHYWPTYFQTIYDRLKPGGRAAIQVITISEKAFESYRREPDFIQLYIFPGGMLPTIELFTQGASHAGLEVKDTFFFGKDYARTLNRWAESFNLHTDALEAQGFDERFRRTWQYYLAYCEAGFLAEHINVAQVLLEKPTNAKNNARETTIELKDMA
ncbi:MAG: cyclopropane-fatty-acyl-phospholipid synthase family protein [Halothiobacillus sp.]|jgi:cyclopropane-fatty-acyl-phospholipid synthase|nr:cyclopropane-fatty-acyl-phospholipid synthase family protein [Halothiobacillus sp.]